MTNELSRLSPHAPALMNTIKSHPHPLRSGDLYRAHSLSSRQIHTILKRMEELGVINLILSRTHRSSTTLISPVPFPANITLFLKAICRQCGRAWQPKTRITERYSECLYCHRDSYVRQRPGADEFQYEFLADNPLDRDDDPDMTSPESNENDY